MASAVDLALMHVRAGAGGEARFVTQEEAEDFCRRVYDAYPPEGYGTSCSLHFNVYKWIVNYYVGSCE